MKKALLKSGSLILVVALAMSLFACGKKSEARSHKNEQISEDAPWYDSEVVTVDLGINTGETISNYAVQLAGSDEKNIVVFVNGEYANDAEDTNTGNKSFAYLKICNRDTKEITTVDMMTALDGWSYVENVIYSDGKLTLKGNYYDPKTYDVTRMERDVDVESGNVLDTREISKDSPESAKVSFDLGEYEVGVDIQTDELKRGFGRLVVTSSKGNPEEIIIKEEGVDFYKIPIVLPLSDSSILIPVITDGKQYWEYCNYPDFETIEKDDALLPVQVDASQLRAIKWAANGVSFVLHGPPGTGKSQTITAMIANALSKGQRVLFVAEKMAALNVVYQRLKNIGLENFCLELHSNKAQKSKVLDQLNRRINAGYNGHNSNYESNITQIKQLRETLDAYVNELHKQHACGMSIRELIDAYESLQDYKETIQIDKRRLRSLTQEDLEKQKAQMEKLFVVGSVISSFDNNPLAEVKQTEYSQSLRRDIESFYDEYVAVLDKMQNAGNALALQLGWNNPVRSIEWHELLSLSHVVTSRSEVVSSLSSDRLNRIIDVTKAKKEAKNHSDINGT